MERFCAENSREKIFSHRKIRIFEKRSVKKKKRFRLYDTDTIQRNKAYFSSNTMPWDFDQHYFNLYEGIVDVEKKKGMKKEEEEENK